MSPEFFRFSANSTKRNQQLLSFLVFAILATVTVSQHSYAQSSSDSAQRQNLSLSGTLSTAMVGVTYNAVISVSGGKAPYRFGSQNLPSGLQNQPLFRS